MSRTVGSLFAFLLLAGTPVIAADPSPSAAPPASPPSPVVGTAPAWPSASTAPGETRWEQLARIDLRDPSQAELLTVTSDGRVIVLDGPGDSRRSVLWTSDGATTTSTRLPADFTNSGLGVAEGPDGLVLVSGIGEVMRSADGSEWSKPRALKGRQFWGPWRIGDEVVALSLRKPSSRRMTLWRSSDGKAWTSAELPVLGRDDGSVPDFLPTPVGGLIAWTTGPTGAAEHAVVVGPDGEVAAVTLPAAPEGTMFTRMARLFDRLVLSAYVLNDAGDGLAATRWVSVDGSTWEPAGDDTSNLPPDGEVYAPAAGGAVVLSDGRATWSEDGVTWTTAPWSWEDLGEVRASCRFATATARLCVVTEPSERAGEIWRLTLGS